MNSQIKYYHVVQPVESDSNNEDIPVTGYESPVHLEDEESLQFTTGQNTQQKWKKIILVVGGGSVILLMIIFWLIPIDSTPIKALSTKPSMNWTNYQRYDAILAYCKLLAENYSNVEYTEIGSSVEGRAIPMITVNPDHTKPAILIDGGIHAREWISPATATYIMDRLIKDKTYEDLRNMFTWFIVPVINVDGYEYSHTVERLWRKSRSKNNGHKCKGVDLNRNWNIHWGATSEEVFNDPCDDHYAGPYAFSEPETSAVRNASLSHREQIKMYLSFHSHSQLWLLPWAYTGAKKPDNYDELKRLADIGAKALTDTFGTMYKVGTAPDIFYDASGTSLDWEKAVAGVRFSYVLELRSPEYGFLLPADQIVPTGVETMKGVAAAARELHRVLLKK